MSDSTKLLQQVFGTEDPQASKKVSPRSGVQLKVGGKLRRRSQAHLERDRVEPSVLHPRVFAQTGLAR